MYKINSEDKTDYEIIQKMMLELIDYRSLIVSRKLTVVRTHPPTLHLTVLHICLYRVVNSEIFSFVLLVNLIQQVKCMLKIMRVSNSRLCLCVSGWITWNTAESDQQDWHGKCVRTTNYIRIVFIISMKCSISVTVTISYQTMQSRQSFACIV